jgi:hypothetical protein
LLVVLLFACLLTDFDIMAKTYKIETRILVALAFAAQRANGGALHRDTRFFDPAQDAFVEVVPNKTLMLNSFAIEPGSNPELVPTDEDFAQADAAISAIQGDVLVKKLADRRVSDFQFNLSETIGRDTCTQRDCGLVAYVPKTYAGMLERQEKDEAKIGLASTSEYLGRVGEKIQLDFTLIDSRYLQQYNCYSVTGHDGCGNMVSFLTAHQNLAVSGRIQGKVKRTEVSQYHNGAKVTNMNFVKRI